MSIAVRRFDATTEMREQLAASLRLVPHLPFGRWFGLEGEAALRWAEGLFAGAAGGVDAGRADALVAVSGRAVVGGVVVREVPFESQIFGVPMARMPFLHTSPAGGTQGAVAGQLIDAAMDTIRAWGTRHCSALVFAEDVASVHAFGERGWHLVDSTLEFTWKCGTTAAGTVDPGVRLREAVPTDREVLTPLARTAYATTIRTRYSADPWLPLDRTGELYAQWFERACDGTFGDVVVVAEMGGRPVGFNTFKLDRALSAATGVGFAAHGIAAVAPDTRGRGIQTALLHWLAEWQRERGGRFNYGRVLINNYSMQRACWQSGAAVTRAYHTFHTLVNP